MVGDLALLRLRWEALTGMVGDGDCDWDGDWDWACAEE